MTSILAERQTDAPAAPDLAGIKKRQHAAWSSGDYAVVGTTLQIVGESLCEAVDLRAGETVLDVAAGNGNASLAAARRYGVVTSTDYVPALLDRGRARAEAEALDIAFQVADAEALGFADASFDVVLSTFGVMFAADQSRAATELLRVTRPDGRIGMANWTPEGFIGRLFGIIGKHVAPPAGAQSPARWGNRAWINAEFGPQAETISATTRFYTFRYRSPEHFVEVFRTWYGPTLKAFGALDATGQAALARDICGLIDSLNRAHDGTVAVPSEYLEIVIRKA